MNKFIEDLKAKLINEKNISESSANLYIKNLLRLNNKQPFEKLLFLKNIEDIDNKIEALSDNTKKTILASIVSVLSMFKDTPAYKKVYKIYYDKMMAISSDMKKIDSADMSSKQKLNWISWKEIEYIKEKLKKSVLQFNKNKTLNEFQYQLLLHYIILLLYFDLAPRRNSDYQHMDFMTEYNNEPVELNILDYKNKRFIFNKFKTAKKYGQQIVEFAPTDDKLVEFNEGLDLYLRFHPLNTKGTLKFTKGTTFPFLVYYNGTRLSQVNSVTRILNKIFGKKVSSSMLRHIYLSSKYNIEEMKKDAQNMGHSLNEQRQYLKDDKEEKNDNVTKEI